MQWSASDIAAQAEEDFEAAWMRTIDLVPEGGYASRRKGKPHALSDLSQRLRDAFLRNGYNEAFLPFFTEENELPQQLGPEARLALEDSFAASTYSRPLPSQGRQVLDEIRKIAPTFNEARLDKLRNLLSLYSQEEFASDRLLSRVVQETGLRMEQAAEVIGIVSGHSELKQTGLLLRSSLAVSWFETLVVTSRKEPLPLQMFAIGTCFRRGAKGTRAYYLASGVVMAESVSVADGEAMLKALLEPLGAKLDFSKSPATSKLFIPGTEAQFYSNSTPLGRIGLLSPIALSGYGLSTPVLVFEFTLEGLAVACGAATEEREALYPQFFGEWTMADVEIAKLVRLAAVPSSWGREIEAKITKTARLYPQQPAPCEFKLVEKEVGEHKVEVWLVAAGNTLCGRDYDNALFIYDGNIVSSTAIGTSPLEKDAVARGVKTGITFLSAFAAQAATMLEANPTKPFRLEYSFIADPSDVNVVVPELVRRYVRSKGKSLSVGGEVGLAVETRVKTAWHHENPK